MHRSRRLTSPSPNKQSAESAGGHLPSLATAEQIAGALQVTTRTVHYWAQDGIIPTAFRQGKVVRFHPPQVAAALGLDLPEFRVPQAGHNDPSQGGSDS